MQITLSPDQASVLGALLADEDAVARARVAAEDAAPPGAASINAALGDLGARMMSSKMYSREQRLTAAISRTRGQLQYSRHTLANGGRADPLAEAHAACSHTEMQLALDAAKKHNVSFDEALAELQRE